MAKITAVPHSRIAFPLKADASRTLVQCADRNHAMKADFAEYNFSAISVPRTFRAHMPADFERDAVSPCS